MTEWIKHYHAKAAALGLRTTKQREAVANVVAVGPGHLTAEEILEGARQIDPALSLATVYRTLKSLQEAGLVIAHHFGDLQAKYEPSFGADKDRHHDHLICTKCQGVEEFVNDEIEKLQEDVALSYGFFIQEHKLEIYGICHGCRKGE